MDIDTLIGILVLVFWIFGMGMGRKKKKSRSTVPAPTDQAGTARPAPASFEEALRQIREALGDIDDTAPGAPVEIPEPERVANRQHWEPTVPTRRTEPQVAARSGRAPDERPERSRSEWEVGERVVYDQSFEGRPAFRGDRFKPAGQNRGLEVATRKEPAPAPRASRPQQLQAMAPDAHGARGRHIPSARRLQEAFLWREILGPPRAIDPSGPRRGRRR